MFIVPIRVPSTVPTLPLDPYNNSVGLTEINALILSKKGLRCGEANHVAQCIKSFFEVFFLGLTSSKFKLRLKRK